MQTLFSDHFKIGDDKSEKSGRIFDTQTRFSGIHAASSQKRRKSTKIVIQKACDA